MCVKPTALQIVLLECKSAINDKKIVTFETINRNLLIKNLEKIGILSDALHHT